MSGKLDVFYPLTFYDLLKNAFEHFMKRYCGRDKDK